MKPFQAERYLGLLFWISIKANDEAIAAPKFDVAPLDKILHLLGRLDVVGTIQRLDRDQVTVGPDGISHVFWHPNPPPGHLP